MGATEAVPGRRPLVGEPPALDLLNTRWVVGNAAVDLLDTVAGLRAWLAEIGLAERFPAGEGELTALRHARDVIRSVVDRPEDTAPREALNSVLAHGRVRRLLGSDGQHEEPEFDDPAWGPAWTAADDYLRLLRRAPDRIRACAHPDCVLYFFDTSKNGTRRWCSMAGCGNRAKAARHYARGRAGE